MRNKILVCLVFVFLAPMAAFARESVPEATTTPTKSELEAKKAEKKDEIRKQLSDTLNVCSALINKIQNLEERVLERESVVISQANLSEETQNEIGLKHKKLEEVLASANQRTNDTLPKLAEAVLDSEKPAKAVQNFKKEVNKIKAELISAHKLVTEIIDLIKKETLKVESKESGDDEVDEAATTSDKTSD